MFIDFDDESQLVRLRWEEGSIEESQYDRMHSQDLCACKPDGIYATKDVRLSSKKCHVEGDRMGLVVS